MKEKDKELPKVNGDCPIAKEYSARSAIHQGPKGKECKRKRQFWGGEPFSVRRACSILQAMGVNAHPMHVVLGLESNVELLDGITSAEDNLEGNNWNKVKLPLVLVTFEGSARGLHFDGVDTVFVVGCPT